MNMKLSKKILSGVCSFALVGSLSGCKSEITNDSDIDVIDSNVEEFNGYNALLDVKDENFKVIVTYYTDIDKDWTITDNKKLGMSIKTADLPDDYKVYIDNVHTDTTIVSNNSAFNGIKQDTMDDRVHTSKLIGFPISDRERYYGIISIDGQSKEFSEETLMAYDSSNKVSNTDGDFLESDYLKEGVYGNKISSVIDLLVHKPGMKDNDYIAVSVSSDIIVKCKNYVKIKDKDDTYYLVYDVDSDGSVKTQKIDDIKTLKKSK